jgi:hypothetical protein
MRKEALAVGLVFVGTVLWLAVTPARSGAD